ncbi:hypothetical protein [Gordonia sp. N1V]|uniref:hypothetical protein n=1 Tax=Gordonia sp. N1V TaxID=3034163 RepID=UPI0023E299DC|nr:hypothetical protein [Gordonia sp. N1V]MDF3280885.1 hypothetical protein [Gordonia sp. N1V]
MTYPIVTICGTMKLYRQMLTVADELTRQGAIVLMPFTRKCDNSWAVHSRVKTLSQRDGRTYDPDAIHLNATPIADGDLDRMHRTKIGMSDLVVVVTDFTDHVMVSDSLDLYFGESTTAEIEFARELGKPIKLARVERSEYCDTIVWLESELQ